MVSAAAGDRQLNFLGPVPVPAVKDKTCTALAALSITKLGPGRCHGVASSSCEVEAEAKAQVSFAIKTLLSKGPVCAETGDALADTGRAVGSALAKAFSSALVKVKCDGAQGLICGYAVGGAAAWGQAYAEVIALAIAEAETPFASSFCSVDVQAIGDAVASAFARAKSNACIFGAEGTIFAFSEAFAKAIVCIFTEAWSRATAAACTNSSCGGAGSALSKTSCASIIVSGTQQTAVSTSGPTAAVADTEVDTIAIARKTEDCTNIPDAIGCCFNQRCPWSPAKTIGKHRTFHEYPDAPRRCTCPF